MKTGNLDVAHLAHRLHSIRQDAYSMEEGLKRRKKIMVETGLEKAYQNRKKVDQTPPGFNTIANKQEYTNEQVNFEVIVKEQGELVYQNKVHGGVISLVERIKDIDEFGTIDGQTQRFVFGHPLAFWFAFDQLQQNIEAKRLQIMAALKRAVEERKFVDPEVKRRIIDAANQVRKNK
jgi:hypothetical protein